MNLGHLSDTNVTRASSFFIEDILLSKPKQLCRDYGSLSALIRPTLPAEYGYHCIPTPPMFFPHMLSHVQGLAAKHSEHPFLVPSSGECYGYHFIIIISFNFLYVGHRGSFVRLYGEIIHEL